MECPKWGYVCKDAIAMKILVVSATFPEVESAASALKHPSELLVTGPGMVMTAYHLSKKLAHSKFDLVLNAGIAGSFRRTLTPGSLVHVISDCFSELGAEDGDQFLPASALNFNEDEFPFHPFVFENRLPFNNPLLEKLNKAKGITVNTVHGNEQSIHQIIQRLNPDVESMEGAAVFYVCMKEKIPCMQVRAISNFVERRNRENWQMDIAIKNLNACLKELLHSFA